MQRWIKGDGDCCSSVGNHATPNEFLESSKRPTRCVFRSLSICFLEKELILTVSCLFVEKGVNGVFFVEFISIT